MSDWGSRTYGDPCTGCGWSWSIDVEGAIAMVVGAPAVFAALLDEVGPSARHQDLAWTAVGYVAHVTDNLRIWAERLANAAAGSTAAVRSYDSEALADARGYAELPAAGALWSLGRAVRDWQAAVELARGATLRHPDRGVLTVDDVVRTNAHDVAHHQWDVGRAGP